MLPRESASKELDSSLLSIITFPAFSVPDASLADYTRNLILQRMLVFITRILPFCASTVHTDPALRISHS